MSASRRSTSSMEQGELEASPDLQHSPQIILEPDESGEPFTTVRSGRMEKSNQMKHTVTEISSPDRPDDVDDVLIIQPPQPAPVATHVSHKDRRRHRHKESKRRSKEDKQTMIASSVDRRDSRKTDRQLAKHESKYPAKMSKREQDLEAEELRRKKSLAERERLERLERERHRLERERDRKYREQQERAAREEAEKRQAELEKRLRAEAERSRDRDRLRGDVNKRGDKRVRTDDSRKRQIHDLPHEDEMEHRAQQPATRLPAPDAVESVDETDSSSEHSGVDQQNVAPAEDTSDTPASHDSDDSSKSSSSSPEQHSDHQQSDHHEADAASSASRRSSHTSSHHSSRGADTDDDDRDGYLSTSPVPSPVELKPQLPPYFPALQGCRNVEEFQCLNRIEEGTYGVVYRAVDRKTEEIVALKRLKMEKEKEGFPITSLREINTLLKAQHPNIVTVREIVVGSNMDKIYIVMDYVEHDLKALMETMKESFSIGEVKTLMLQLLRGVQHLHDNWIIHRDLKASNLLLSHKGILKIGDFGLAREYGSPLRPYTPIVVTLWYRAPELLLGAKEYTTPIDMWSVGCIFAEFLMKKPLFPGKSEIDELNRIFKELGTPTEKIWPGVGELPAMKKCTFTEYPYNQLRSRFGSLLSDRGFDLLNKFLTYNPVRRITADDACRHDFFTESPLPVDPSMFPTWPAKSEQSRASRSHGNSPKPPSGGKAYAKLLGDDDDLGSGFHLNAPGAGIAAASGFALKF